MTSSISWIDPEGLAKTLARVNRGRRRDDRRRRDRRRSSRSEAPPAAEAESQDAVAEAEPVTREFVPPAGALRQRLEAYTDWLMELSGSRSAFVVDRDGMALVDVRTDPNLLAIASSFLRLVERINDKLVTPLGRTVTLEHEDHLLLLIFVETTIGEYIVGHVGDRRLDREATQAAADALRRAFEQGSQSGHPVGP
jgi:hypothetical protein